MKKLLLIIALLASLPSFAHDFEVDGIYYNKTSDTEVSVTYRGTSSYDYSNEYTGDVIIPSTVSYNSVEYSVTSIGDAAFIHCETLTSVTIPNSVTTIGGGAFDSCEALTSVTIPNSVNTIGVSAFSHCYALTSVTIPNSITTIEDWTFLSCSALNSVVIPNSVTSIGQSAFWDCSALTSVTIPNSVITIGAETFSGCDNLENINVEAGNHHYSSENGVLYNSDKTVLICCPAAKTTVEIPNSVTSIDVQTFSGCESLETINIEDGNEYYSSENGVLFNKDKTVLVRCPRAKSKYVIPNSVITIGESAFDRCNALTSIIIPHSVTSIGEGAFYYCRDLSFVTISSSVTSIGESAFRLCINIKNIYYLSENPINATDIFHEKIFTTATLHIPASALEKIKSTEPWMNFKNIDTQYSEMMSPIFNEEMGDVITIGPNSKFELTPAFHAFGPAKGVQFDLTLPQGLSLSDVTASGADKDLNGLVASQAKLNNGDFRVLIYTNDGAELGDIMLGMSFESDATLERGAALCHNIMHSIFDTEVVLDDETAFVTGYDVIIPEVSIEELETLTLPAPLSANIDNVTYRWGEVEPSDIASLSTEGVITAKNPGKAVYSLYVKDGDRPEKKYTALLEVIASIWGDADKDGSVNISDLVAVVNYILERSPENFDTRLADIDHNGRINIVDLTGIVKILLSQKNEDHTETYSTFAARQELTFGEVETLADNCHHIALEIDPTDDYTAMQTDIRLPEGVKLEALTLGDDLNGHTVDYAEIDETTVRVIIYSPTLAGMTTGKKIAMADLVLSGELTEDAVISAGETLACDTDGYAYTIASTDKGMGGTTAISTTISSDCKAISVSGGIELTASEATAVRITDLSGRSVAETVAPATVCLEAGVYLVTFENGATLKVLVK